MVTAADGAINFYNADKTSHTFFKVDSPEKAIKLDRKLINAYVGHPHFTIIDNSTLTFQEKINRCVDAVLKFIGLPTPTSFYKKFLLKS